MTNKVPIDLYQPLYQRDDLKIIHGIGPGIEKRLNEAGIWSYDQVAAMTPEEIVSAVGQMIGMSMKRVVDQDWIGQAKKLRPENRRTVENEKTEHQHYATFSVELLLDDANSVRRTRIIYLQGQDDQTWSGWDAQRVCDTISQKAGLINPAAEKSAAVEEIKPEELEKVPMQKAEISGWPKLMDTKIIALLSNHSGRIQPAGQPFEIQVSIDPKEMIVPENSAVEYMAVVDAKELHTHSHLILGEDKGRLQPGEDWKLSVKSMGLKEGTYRIQTGLTFSLAGQELRQAAETSTNLDAGLLRVY